MAAVLIIITFIIGYLAIAFEFSLKVNKAASALITGVICWTIYIIKSPANESVPEKLLHHLGDISSILFFLLGAMAIVELIDSHSGFDIITQKLKTSSKSKLLLIIAALTFFQGPIHLQDF
jgi:Na+/H+ antiporter NhaD/arsenite permease-like protein